MRQDRYFTPTQLYKEFMILDYLSKNQHVTQREIGSKLKISVSMVNSYLDQYEKKGLIEKKRCTSRNVTYSVTRKGTERTKVLNIGYLEDFLRLTKGAKDNISMFLCQIINKGIKTILLYGAGEVAEVVLQVVNNDGNIPITVVAVIDDDIGKQGSFIVNYPIIDITSVNNYQYDGVLIASYNHRKTMYRNLLNINIDVERIIEFF